ncbi:NAD kinase [Jonesia quinghaiensis]|uniref:NAD kinase n=1 Tax=Jonesia quinghaiensis TaxID=262806 RepID=UPI00055EBF5A|nr:NAD kinase [Jonesia quinghaiensis]
MTRNVLVVTHPGRPEALQALRNAVPALVEHGFDVYSADLSGSTARELGIRLYAPYQQGTQMKISDFEAVMVLGGDGTILRAAELIFGSHVPLLGINLGHVGFLAESEKEDLDLAVARLAGRDYATEERRVLQVTVHRPGFAQPVIDWALNEATVEKAEPARMLEVSISVDGRPLSTFGCDAVILATATGSTAHAFSAGGPIVWPDVAAKVLVPVAAHALFARPLVLGPSADCTIDVLTESGVGGVLVTDGRRQTDIPQGSRVIIKTSDTPIVFARLSSAPFADRLVSKFRLPVEGWRGNGNTMRGETDDA